VNKSIDSLHSGQCLRAVVKISSPPFKVEAKLPRVVSSSAHFGGVLKTVKHWSEVNQCEMTFSIFLPSDVIAT
jgi:hypothetical protein